MNHFLSLLLLFGSLSLHAQDFRMAAEKASRLHELRVNGGQEIKITLTGFREGESYKVAIRNDRETQHFSFGNLPPGATLVHGDYIIGTATATPLELCLGNTSPTARPLTLAVSGRERSSAAKRMNLSTAASTNSDSLLNTVFRDESCFELFPVQLVGGSQVLNDGSQVRQTGTFSGGTDIVGIENGIILTTGFVRDAPGPNDPFIPASGIYGGFSRVDDDAATLTAPFDYFDVAFIEFKFVPTTDNISFDYVFFSEEYCFAINSSFGNDAFGFFLTGPDGVTRNIARLPNGDPITAATLNHITFPTLFRDNVPPGGFSPCTGGPIPPERLAGINYDGFSAKLTASATVTPCDTHTLKLVVVDAGDQIIDSGVLLEAGSFTAGLISDPEPSVQGIAGSTLPVEGCDTATITFERLFFDSADLAMPLEVNYSILTGGGLNMAERGVDYELADPPFIIPPGDTTGVLRIPILADGDDGEGPEALVIRYDGTCNCAVNTDTFFIQDAVDLTVDILQADIQLCAGQEVLLATSVMGGNGNYTYQWPDGRDTSSLLFTATGRDTLIVLEVRDECGLSGRDSVRILAPAIAANISGNYSLCTNTEVQVPLTVSGSDRYEVTVRIDSAGVLRDETYIITMDTSLTLDYSAVVTLTGVRDATGCGGSVSGQATIITGDIDVTAQLTQPRCDGPNGAIEIDVAGGNNLFTFAWMDGPTTLDRANLSPGTYTLTVTRISDPSCPQVFSYVLNPAPVFRMDSIAYRRPVCAGEIITLAPVLTGGTPPYTITWPDSSLVDSLLTVDTQTGFNFYSFLATDACGEEVSGAVAIDLPAFSAELSGRYSLCNGSPALVPLTVAGPTDDYTVTLEIDSAGIAFERALVLSAGTTNLSFPDSATVTVRDITNMAGCTGEIIDGFARVVDPRIDFSATVTFPTCNGGDDGSISLADPGTVPLTFAWSDGGSPGPTRTGLTAGSYTVSITDAADPGCQRDTTFVLSEPPPLTGSSDVSPFVCSNEVVDLIALPQGGTPPYTYLWANGIGTDSVVSTTIPPGFADYPLLVTDACGATYRDTVNVATPSNEASLTGIYSICNAPFNVDVPLTVSGIFSPRYEVTIRENGVERTLVVTGDTLLNYAAPTVIELLGIIGPRGCPGTVSGSATVTDATWNVTSRVSDLACRGQANGTIDVLVNGDNAPYSFQWGQAGLNGPAVSNLAAGIYTLTVTENAATACSWDTSFVVTEPAEFSGSIQGSAVTCAAETVSLAASHSGGTPPFSYDWDDGRGQDSLFTVISLAGANEIPLVITDACGTVVRDTITFLTPNIRAEVAGNFSICNAPFNVDVPLTFSGSSTGYDFTVRENGVPRTLFATGDTTLNYAAATTVQLVSVAARGACTGTAGGIAEVTDASWSVDAQVLDVLCAGRPTGAISVTINGNNAAYALQWDRPNLNGPTVTDLTAGTYSLTITETAATACSWDTTFTILEPPATISFLSDSSRDETCTALAYARASYTGGTGELAYRWSNGTTGNVLGEVPAGVYELSVTDENGCELVQQFNLQDRTSTVLASISASAAELSCTQNTVDLTAQQNVQSVRYAWTDAAGNSLGGTRTVTVNAPGRYYVEAVNPANGCAAVDSIDLGQSGDFLTLILAPQVPITCTNGSVDLTVSHPEFTGAVTYEWRFNDRVVGTAATLPDVTQPGSYVVVATRTDNGCPALAQTEVVIDREAPAISVAGPVVRLNCRLPNVPLAVSAPSGVRYAWRTGDGLLSGATDNSTATAERPGTYVVTVTDTLNGCSADATIRVVTDGEQLLTGAGTDQVLVCDGLGTVLNGTVSPMLAGSEYYWYGPDGREISTTPQAFAREPGAYVFETVHPVSFCSAFDTVNVISAAPTAVAYTVIQPPCPEVGGSVVVNNVTGLNPPFVFSSPRGETDPLGSGVRGLPEGTHELIVTDIFGCEYRETFQIFPAGTLEGDAADVVVRLGEPAELGVTTNRGDGALVQWEWDNIPDTLSCLTCPNPIVNTLESFIATVRVTDLHGCSVDIRQNVIVEERSLLYLPSAFSPNNGDGVNDVYAVFGDPEFVELVEDLQIFDRWGRQVYSRQNFAVNDPTVGWDGMIGGQPAPAAVFVYTVTARYYDGTVETVKGTFTLLR